MQAQATQPEHSNQSETPAEQQVDNQLVEQGVRAALKKQLTKLFGKQV